MRHTSRRTVLQHQVGAAPGSATNSTDSSGSPLLITISQPVWANTNVITVLDTMLFEQPPWLDLLGNEAISVPGVTTTDSADLTQPPQDEYGPIEAVSNTPVTTTDTASLVLI